MGLANLWGALLIPNPISLMGVSGLCVLGKPCGVGRILLIWSRISFFFFLIVYC